VVGETSDTYAKYSDVIKLQRFIISLASFLHLMNLGLADNAIPVPASKSSILPMKTKLLLLPALTAFSLSANAASYLTGGHIDGPAFGYDSLTGFEPHYHNEGGGTVRWSMASRRRPLPSMNRAI
jgi:hypothetical protein